MARYGKYEPYAAEIQALKQRWNVPNKDPKLVDLEFVLLFETEKAYHISVDGKEAWVPKSQCEDNGDGTITMPEWIAKDKELV